MKLIKMLLNNKYAVVEYETGGHMLTMPHIPNVKRLVVQVTPKLLQELENENE